jgi:hypothetical protein
MSGLEQYYLQSAVPDAPKNTGRVPDIQNGFAPQFVVQQEDPSIRRVPYAAQSLIRIHDTTPLNSTFFSDANIKFLQDEIRYRVWMESDKKHVIDAQNLDDLKTIMRSYYLQYSTNSPGKLREEIEELNKRVLAYSVTFILGEINMYLRYRQDQQNFPAPIANPVNANMFGTKSAEFKRFF